MRLLQGSVVTRPLILWGQGSTSMTLLNLNSSLKPPSPNTGTLGVKPLLYEWLHRPQIHMLNPETLPNCDGIRRRGL